MLTLCIEDTRSASGAAREEDEEYRNEREDQAGQAPAPMVPSEPGMPALRQQRASMLAPATGLMPPRMPPRSYSAATVAGAAVSDPSLPSDVSVLRDGTFALERRAGAPTQIYTTANGSGGTRTIAPSVTSASDLSDYGAMSQTRTLDSATTTDDEYQSMSDNSRQASGLPASSPQRSRGWPNAQSGGRNMQAGTSDSSIGAPPLGVAASADSAKPPTSAFSRFLTRPVKRQQSVPFGDGVEVSGDALIRKQLKASDDERKRLKKEAKLRDLLGETPSSIGMMGGPLGF
jgi:hypothetical protein